MVVPLALEYMARHPQVQVDLSFEDRYVDLVAQGIDVAVRMGKLADSSLGARFLGMNPWVMVAAPGYLKKHGTPKRAQDLSAHVALIYSSVVGDDVWRMHTPKGEPVTVPVSGRLRSNNLSAVLAAAREGLGIALMPRYVASDSLAAGKVVRGAAPTMRCPSRRSTRSSRRPSWCRARCQASWPFCRGASTKRWWAR